MSRTPTITSSSTSSWAEASSSTRTRYDRTTRKNRTTTSISTSPPRVRGSRSRSPARAKTFPATRSSRHFSTKLTCLCFPRHPPPPAGETGEPGTSAALEIARNRDLNAASVPSLYRARARALARLVRARSRRLVTLLFSLSQPSSLTVDRFRFSLPLTELGGVRRGSPEQGQGEEAREAPLDADRDHGRGGAGETREEGGEESGEGACIPHPTRRLPSQHETRASDFRRFLLSLFLVFPNDTSFSRSLCPFVKKSTKFTRTPFFFYSRAALTSPLPYVSPSPLVANSQEAKAEARKERLDFELNGPNKQMTKKERRRLEAEGLN